MGRSTVSCLKIIACGRDSVDKDDVEAPEGPSDKRGWSFRKRSARHRMLSNIVTSETQLSLNKETPETVTINFQTQSNITFPEKTPAVTWIDEQPDLSAAVKSELSDASFATEKDDTVAIINLDESVVVFIQAAIRGILAQKELLKLKNVVKLQATIRGHLVRRHAVGTLRCIHAIVKMQALVRAHQARLCLEEDSGGSMLSEKGNVEIRPNITHTSIEKLLSNKFAHQLLESTPRTKRIYVKCDWSKSDSTWKWLERWMSVSSRDVEQPQKLESGMKLQQQDEVEQSVSQLEPGSWPEDCNSMDLKATNGELGMLLASGADSNAIENEENLITYDVDNFDFLACKPTSSSERNNLEAPQPQVPGSLSINKNSADLNQNQNELSDSASQIELNSVSGNAQSFSRKELDSLSQLGLDSASGKPPTKGEELIYYGSLGPTPQQTEGKKVLFGSRKATNPAFIAAHSKFEELRSTVNSARSTNSCSQDVVESNSSIISSVTDDAINMRDTVLAENSVSYTSIVQLGGSECGTELSISSTLDSPDRSEIGLMDVKEEAKISDEQSSNANNTKDINIEPDHEPTISGSHLSYSTSVQPEKLDDADGTNGGPANTGTALDSSEGKQKSETNASYLQIELISEMGHQVCKSSPEASPRSHATVPESQGTPSSQVSVNAKKAKSDRSVPSQKCRSLSSGKKSPLNSKHDSGVKSSLEQLSKDHKEGKQHNSFGSGKTDPVDQEPRDSSSSNSLPSYMQATESARAKALANSSPRSSPQVVLEKDIIIKKRHSLPSANGRQGSPNIQRSASQAQQGSKGNGHPHERKWQR